MSVNDVRSSGVSVAAAVLDLDSFSEVNNSYGEEVGDLVMRQISQTLMASFGNFLIARAGGQQFFALLVGLDNKKATAFIESLRKVVSSTPLQLQGHDISVTFSAGVSNKEVENLSQLVSIARACLERAKEAGGDFVCGDE